MAIKPVIGRKSKNPPILSHEFVIQNHADIVSCIAMVFVVGLMLQATTSVASLFISLHHNITGTEPTHENPRGEPYFYVSGYKDYCAIFFYTLICIIMHAILQEYVLDKISKKLHLSKYKLSLFNESGQLVVFYAMSFLWGIQVMIRDGFVPHFTALWEGFPVHPMTFLHKLFFVIQLAYYLHMLPELYFQRVKQEDQQPKIIHAIVGFSAVALPYFLNFQRPALVLLTIHYLGDFIVNILQLIEIFDREERYSNLRFVKNLIFALTRLATMGVAVLVLYFGVTISAKSPTGLLALGGVLALEGFMVFASLREVMSVRREQSEAKTAQTAKKPKASKVEKTNKKKQESDLPEADQSPRPIKGKQKTK